MAELPLAAGLMDLRNCKLSPKPPPTAALPLPVRRRTHATATAPMASSPRRAVPELHSTTELADGSIVFRFGHPKSQVLEPEPEPANQDLGVTAETGPGSEHGVDGARVGATSGVEAQSLNAATEAWPTPPPPDAGKETGVTSAVLEEEGSVAAVDVSGGLDEATGTAGLEDSEAASEGSTTQDFDTDVETESSGSSSDEQRAEFGVSLPPPEQVSNKADRKYDTLEANSSDRMIPVAHSAHMLSSGAAILPHPTKVEKMHISLQPMAGLV